MKYKDLKHKILENCKRADNGCVEWTAARSNDGYGRLSIKGKYFRAHRVSYELFKGEIPEGMLVCHTCDNPICIDPEHLFLGTAWDNTLDRLNKGRGTPMKLSDEEVACIRRHLDHGVSHDKLAKWFDVSTLIIHNIRHNKGGYKYR